MRQNKNKNKTIGVLAILLALLLLVGACSTEKNTFVNRTYHSVTAKYNGHFNANELIRLGLADYRATAREDFTNILPVELFPNEEDVVNFYPTVDTAIAKCQKVISKHSMPTSSKPSKKKTEYAKFIDENWFTIGYAKYIRRDYDSSLIVFKYIRKFYVDRPSSYSGQLWEAKTYIQTGDLVEATRTLQKIEKRKSLISDEKNDKKSKEDKEEKAPPLPKDFDFELAKTKASLAIAKEDYETAINQLKIALDNARKKTDVARISFILGQLLQRENDTRARDYYTISIKKNAPFEMSFNAKINRAVVSNLGDDEMIKELKDLAKESRYMEFRDQVYFAMSEVELKRQEREKAKYYLSKSVFYSLNNDLQKGISYEKLGDLTFEEKDYVSAQRYYDSSAQVMPESYQNAEVIKNKADKLADLVENIDIITFEDSVQMIAGMDEKSREKFLKDVVKQLKKEEEERKKREAERAEKMRKLQQTYAEQNQKPGAKFYFSNAKAVREGVEEFKRIWGQRKNEDYWRLSNKPSITSMDVVKNDSIPNEIATAPKSNKTALDSLSHEDLLSDIPLTDSAMQISNENLLAALYNSGMIYKEQLNEIEMGAAQFQRIIDHNVENEHNLLAAFQLYKMNENTEKATEYKDYIINNYPNSDYANYLRDPDYFIKKKERDALALQDYLRSVKHFEQGLFYPVILKSDDVIEKEPTNKYRKEYFLLKAMAMGQINQDKTSLLPVLNQAVEEFPGTDVASKAKEYIELINNGVPPFEEFKKPEIDIFSTESKSFYVLIKLKGKQNINSSTNNVSNYNNDYFSRLKLSTSNQMYDKVTHFVLVKEFKTAGEAKSYIKDFKRSKRHVVDLKGNEIMPVSKENYKIILLEQKLEDYKKFFEKYYE